MQFEKEKEAVSLLLEKKTFLIRGVESATDIQLAEQLLRCAPGVTEASVTPPTVHAAV